METHHMSSVAPKKTGAKSWIILGVALIVVVAAVYFVTRMLPGRQSTAGSGSGATSASVQLSEYKAVFLTNNQVYFGKMSSNTRNDFMKLENVFYLQQQPQALGKDKAAGSGLAVIKLGSEVYGPTDSMYINRDQVLLIEDLRADSNLVKTIENMLKAQTQ